jgi:hypothetical protein
MKRRSQHLGKIISQHSCPQFHLATEVGTSKNLGGGQGSHNKPTGCGASGAYVPGPDDEEEKP